MARCPICASETSRDWRPFCSRRCADIDLARWMGGHYVVEGRDGEAGPEPEEDGSTEAGPSRRH
ncbi:MAG: DNA gyrase inhibitor YacG [Pseudomonadota bacterium]